MRNAPTLQTSRRRELDSESAAQLLPPALMLNKCALATDFFAGGLDLPPGLTDKSFHVMHELNRFIRLLGGNVGEERKGFWS